MCHNGAHINNIYSEPIRNKMKKLFSSAKNSIFTNLIVYDTLVKIVHPETKSSHNFTKRLYDYLHIEFDKYTKKDYSEMGYNKLKNIHSKFYLNDSKNIYIHTVKKIIYHIYGHILNQTPFSN